jgi:hypothetical protein
VIAGLAGALAVSGVASAAVTAVRTGFSVSPPKQDKKVRGPVSVFFESNDQHSGAFLGQPGCLIGNEGVGCYAFPPSVKSFITFPTDLKFDPGNMPDCNLASLVGQSTAGAKAACPKSIVGGGTNVQAFSDGSTRSGVITAFNGAPSGGKPSLYLHIDLPGVTTKPILNGVISGNTLDVQIPPVPGTVIQHFDTSLNPVVVGKNKKTGKKRYYLSAKCSKKQWSVTEDVTYQNGQHQIDTESQPCKQKKKK